MHRMRRKGTRSLDGSGEEVEVGETEGSGGDNTRPPQGLHANYTVPLGLGCRAAEETLGEGDARASHQCRVGIGHITARFESQGEDIGEPNDGPRRRGS